MLFSSYAFVFLFLPVILLAFGTARLHSERAAILALVAASLHFYGSWKPVYLLLLLASLALNYAIGLAIRRSPRPGPVAAAGVAINLAALAYFKYANFLSEQPACSPPGSRSWTSPRCRSASRSSRSRRSPTWWTQRGRARRARLALWLFVTFFPHLIAGPIVHHAR